jgi:hypothetical protein
MSAISTRFRVPSPRLTPLFSLRYFTCTNFGKVIETDQTRVWSFKRDHLLGKES